MATSKIISSFNSAPNTNLFWTSGSQSTGDWSVIYCSTSGRVANLVFYVRSSSIGNLDAWKNYSFGQLPFRPVDNIYVPVATDRSTHEGTQWQVNWEGYVYLSTRYNSLAAGSGDILRGSLTFLIADYN